MQRLHTCDADKYLHGVVREHAAQLPMPGHALHAM